MNAPLPLVADGVLKRFGPRTVLDGLGLQVGRGETVVLRGPNGSGKSTLIGCVCGTVMPDAGTITIGGHSLGAEPLSARARLRYLPQEIEIPPGLTGHELLQFFADVHDAPSSAPRAAEFTGFGEALERLATTYSVGMRRLLAFATLLPGRASLWVLDEPFAGVDAEGRAKMLEVLEHARADGRGILLAAHDRDAPELKALQAREVELRRAPESSRGEA